MSTFVYLPQKSYSCISKNIFDRKAPTLHVGRTTVLIQTRGLT